MKILLHIGQGKTGTSSVHTFLTRRREQLAHSGVLYPAVRVKGLPLDISSHNVVADALAGAERYPYLRAEQYFEQFFAEADHINAQLMILSGEHFFGGEPRVWDVSDEAAFLQSYRKKLAALAYFLKGHEVSILVYLRPQVDWVASNIVQTICFSRSGNRHHTYPDDMAYFEQHKPLLRYTRRLDLWREALSPRSFNVVPYVRERLHGRSSVTDFLEQAGLRGLVGEEEAVEIQSNVTISREYAEVKKRLNAIPRSDASHHAVVRTLRKLSKASSMGSGYRLDPAVVRAIEEFTAPDNARLETEYLAPGERFPARVAYAGDALPPLDETDISRAMAAFEREYARPRVQALRLRYAALAFLRRYARPAHLAVHQVKRWKRMRKYGAEVAGNPARSR